MINIERAWSSLLSSSKKRRFTVLRIFLAFFVIPLIESDQWPTALGNLSFYRLFFFGRFFHLPPSHRDGTAIKAGRIKAPMRGVYLCMSSFVCWRFLFVYFASSLVCVCVCVCVCVDAVLSASVPVTHIHGGRRRNKGRRDAIMQKSVRLHAAAIPILIPLINRPAPHQKAPRHGRNNGAPRKVLPPPPRASSINDFGFANSPPTIEPEGRAWFLNFFFYLDHEIIHRKQGLEDFC